MFEELDACASAFNWKCSCEKNFDGDDGWILDTQEVFDIINVFGGLIEVFFSVIEKVFECI